MTRTQQAESRQEELALVERLAVRIRQHVLQTLGKPPGWHVVQVRPLWDGHFRVNVLIGQSIADSKIGHSFFVQTDDAGDVLDSNPKMIKRY